MPVLKSVELNSRLFSIIYIRQYSNSSIVNLNIDWDNFSNLSEHQSTHTHFDLFISNQYDCQFMSGTGGDGHFHTNFIVSPPLPENVSGIKLIFKEYSLPLTDTPVGEDIIIQL